MDKEWITVVGTLAGVMFGGLLTYLAKFSEFRLQTKRDTQRLIQSKLEDLHERVCEYIIFSSNYANSILKLEASPKGLFSPKISLKTINEYTLITDKITLPLPKIDTLLKVYAPELEPEWNKLTQAVNNLHIYGAEYVKSGRSQNEFLKYNQPVVGICKNILEHLEKRMQNDLKSNL